MHGATPFLAARPAPLTVSRAASSTATAATAPDAGAREASAGRELDAVADGLLLDSSAAGMGVGEGAHRVARQPRVVYEPDVQQFYDLYRREISAERSNEMIAAREPEKTHQMLKGDEHLARKITDRFGLSLGNIGEV
jgi:hypothetical protein